MKHGESHVSWLPLYFFNKIKPHLLRRALLYAWFNLGVIPPPEALWWLSYSGMYHWEHRGVWCRTCSEYERGLRPGILLHQCRLLLSTHTTSSYLYDIYVHFWLYSVVVSVAAICFCCFFGGPNDFLIDLCFVSFPSMFCSAAVLLWFTLLPYKASSAVTATLVKVEL